MTGVTCVAQDSSLAYSAVELLDLVNLELLSSVGFKQYYLQG